MAIKQVGVIGCGLMGSGIAQVSSQAGFPTVVIEANQAFLDKGLGGLRKSLESLVAKAKIDERAKDETLGRLKGSVQLDDLKDCDLVIEAITENQAVKNESFAKLDAFCRPHALLASNTSSCMVTAMAAATITANATYAASALLCCRTVNETSRRHRTGPNRPAPDS